ncbi:MAG: hypothetical protein FWD70_06930, partial [Desulfuromonadales bacterium]|nr:hypothetical protein [Desulfuromonadales bacterium]
MTKKEIRNFSDGFTKNSSFNYLVTDKPLDSSLIGMKFFEPPLIGIANADDPIFRELQNKEVIGNHFMLPTEWLPEAKSVISFFFPFTRQIIESNRNDMSWPSDEWLHGRIEGQSFISGFTAALVDYFKGFSIEVVAPSLDKR